MGVALGLANSYLKRCMRKGWIKISEAPANRYLYYLTPTGFAEKSRLTAKYLSYSFAFYRRAGSGCAALLADCAARDWKRVLLCGISDLAEIALLRAQEHPIDIVGIYDPHSERRRYGTKSVWHDFSEVAEHDACLLTDIQAPLVTLEHLSRLVPRERILVPDILGVAPPGAA
jgi:hypothetical protein